MSYNRYSFTVFVDNLPQKLDRYGLKGIFQKVGKVSDSYIPSKKGKWRKRFGFVRFWDKEDAVNSIRMFNGTKIRGNRISVCMAKYGKGGNRSNEYQASKPSWNRKLQHKPRKVWREKITLVKPVESNHMMQIVATTLKGETNVDFMEWLTRSVVCESEEPLDLEILSKALVKDECSKICALSKFKFILTYHTVEQLEESLKNKEKLANWFHIVKKWDIYEFCESRRAWIEVFGVPPHGWTLQNFKNIASLWGKMVCLETPIEETISFESMKILIDNVKFQDIGGSLTLHIGDAGYRILVKEASYTFQINPQFVVPSSSSPMVGKGSSEDIRKTEIIGEDVALSNEMGINHWPNGNKVVTASLERVISGNSKCEFEVDNGQIGAKRGNCSPVSINSSPSFKTRMAQISQNGYSEEIFKLSHKVPDSQIVEAKGQVSAGCVKLTNDLGNNEHPRFQNTSHYNEPLFPPGFGPQAVDPCGENSVPNLNRVFSDPPGFERQNVEESDECSVLPGFELTQPVKQLGDSSRSLKVKAKAQKSQHEGQGKRLTRSQAKKVKGSIERNHNNLSSLSVINGNREGSPHSTRSSKTTESMAKLALDSLEIGELLGVKVIDKKEVALKRITSGLKKERKARATFRIK